MEQWEHVNKMLDAVFGPVRQEPPLPKDVPMREQLNNLRQPERRTLIEDVCIEIGQKRIYVTLDAAYKLSADGSPYITNLLLNGEDIGVPDSMGEFVADAIAEDIA